MGYSEIVVLNEKFNIHTLVLPDNNSIINVNGLDTIAFGIEDWTSYNKQKYIDWYDNK
jgi:hypothetical protein